MNKRRTNYFLAQKRGVFANTILLLGCFALLLGVFSGISHACEAFAIACPKLAWFLGSGGLSMAIFPPGTTSANTNYGRFTDQISGINGVSAGGQCVINMPTNQRYHRVTINTTDAAAAAGVSTVITNVQLVVSGIVVRDLTPAQILKIAQCNGYLPQLGELPIFFSEPWTNVNEPSDITSWDMWDQSSFQIRLTLAGGTTPGLTGWFEFDYQRNGYIDNGKFVPKLQIVSQKVYTLQTAAAQNVIVSPTIPINYPLRRIYMEVGAGNITAIQALQDGNTIANFQTNQQMVEAYRAYGFKFAQQDIIQFQNATGPANLSQYATLETLAYFKGALIFDVDQRLWKSLKVAQQLKLLITTSSSTSMNLIYEAVPGAYA